MEDNKPRPRLTLGHSTLAGSDLDADADGDLVANGIDNCVLVPNRDQTTIGTYSQGAACNQRAGFNPAPTIVPPD